MRYSKVIRGFGGAAISATQDLSDFFGLEDGRYGRAIINNSKNKIILNLEPDEAEFVRDTLKLTKTEIRSITRFERGEALICSNNSKVPVIIKASKEEQEMITTDRAELEAILRSGSRRRINSAYFARNTHFGANEYKKEVVIVLLTDEQYVVKWLSQYGALPRAQIIKRCCKSRRRRQKKDPAESEKADAYRRCFRWLLYRA